MARHGICGAAVWWDSWRGWGAGSSARVCGEVANSPLEMDAASWAQETCDGGASSPTSPRRVAKWLTGGLGKVKGPCGGVRLLSDGSIVWSAGSDGRLSRKGEVGSWHLAAT